MRMTRKGVATGSRDRQFSAGESAILSPRAGCEKVFASIVKWSGLFYELRDNGPYESA